MGDPVYTTRTISQNHRFNARDGGVSTVTSVQIPQYEGEKLVAAYVNNVNITNDSNELAYGRFSYSISGNTLNVTFTMQAYRGGTTFYGDVIGVYAKV